MASRTPMVVTKLRYDSRPDSSCPESNSPELSSRNLNKFIKFWSWFNQKYQAIYFTCIIVDTFEKTYQSETDTESRLKISYSESLSTNPSPTETPLVSTSQNPPLNINNQNKDTKSLNFEEAYFNTINQRRNMSRHTRLEGNYLRITHINNRPTVKEQTNMYIPDDSHRMVEDPQNQQQTPPPKFDNQQTLQTLLRGINEMFESNAARAA
ncbi:15622_t:CDS:2, partial [Dentiscutata erythropus]